MTISEKKMQIVIDNYFESECDVNTSIRQAFDKGFRIGVKKGSSIEPERKTGKWMWIQKGLKWECDQCGCRIGRAKPFSGNMWNYYYCPNCGVKMEEGEQDGQTN